MKFQFIHNKNIPKKKISPKIGHIRIKKYFSWFPCIVEIETDITSIYKLRWLETVKVEQQYKECCYIDCMGHPRIKNKWVNIGFID